MTAILSSLQGKKTYISAGALVLLGVVLIWLGQSSLGMLAVLQGLGLVGLGDRANRHQAEILQMIRDTGYATADLVAHSPAARTDICRVVADVGKMAAAQGLPSAADLDAVAEEEQTRQATAPAPDNAGGTAQ